MKNQIYSIKLTAEQVRELTKFIGSKKHSSETKTHAKVLLCLNENSEKPMTVKEAAQKCKLHAENIYKIRKQFVTEGMARVLNRKKRETPPVPAKITGEVEAHIIATACSTPPEGRKAWTLTLIGNKIVLDGVIDSLSNESIRLVLKKHNLSLT